MKVGEACSLLCHYFRITLEFLIMTPDQGFSTFPTLQPFNIILHVVVTPNHKIIS